MNFEDVKSLVIPEGEVKFIKIDGKTVWRTRSWMDEYQQVEYLENDDLSQYIDTGVIPNENTKIKIKLNMTKFTGAYNSTNHIILGARTGAGSDFVFREDNNNFGFGSKTIHGVVTNNKTVSLNNTYEVEMYGSTIIVDGEESSHIIPAAITNFPTDSIGLFHWIDETGYDNARVYYKLYYCQIWNGEELIRDFVPCYRKSDNVVGLYDIVNDVFYTNLGSGSLKIGLPIEFEQIEYIETSGTQYINTGVKPTINTKVEIETTSDYQSSNALLGSRKLSTYNNFILFNRLDDDGVYQRISPQFYNQTNATGTEYFSYNTTVEGYVTIIMDKTGAYANGVQYQTFSNIASAANNYDMFLFTFNEAGTPDSRYYRGKTKYCKIYEDNILVRNLIPCIRKSDKLAGMFDTINQKFYINIGTGKFGYGENDELV